MKLQSLVVAVVLAVAPVVAHAQTGLFLNPIAMRISNSTKDTGLFAFLASMDNYPVSIFLTDARMKTLPTKMLQYIEESPDPSIAALSTLILLATLALLFIADRAVGLHRLAGLAE